MTRKELEIREKAVLNAFGKNDIDAGIDYVLKLYERNPKKKLFRFRPPKQHEIDAIKMSQLYLCRPSVYEDYSDCEWIDDIEGLVNYEVKVRNVQKYKIHKALLTPDKCKEIAEDIKKTPRYVAMKEKARNMCLISCITDKMTDYMWEKYASDSQGICLEYGFEEVLKKIADLNLRFFPVRYVDDRTGIKDIQFGAIEYAEDATDDLMIRKYILSCMTKNKVPYAKESEWRVLCEYMDESVEKGKLFDFIKPCKIYLGKNISKNEGFERAILTVADELSIPVYSTTSK